MKKQVDEPTDPFNLQMEKLTKAPAVFWAAFFTAGTNAVIEALDKIADAPEPVREVNVNEPIK